MPLQRKTALNQCPTPGWPPPQSGAARGNRRALPQAVAHTEPPGVQQRPRPVLGTCPPSHPATTPISGSASRGPGCRSRRHLSCFPGGLCHGRPRAASDKGRRGPGAPPSVLPPPAASSREAPSTAEKTQLRRLEPDLRAHCVFGYSRAAITTPQSFLCSVFQPPWKPHMVSVISSREEGLAGRPKARVAAEAGEGRGPKQPVSPRTWESLTQRGTSPLYRRRN